MFKTALNKFIELDDKIIEKEKRLKELEKPIREFEKPIKEMKKEKTKLEDYIKNFIVENKLENKDIKVNKYRITYGVEEKAKTNITQKFLKDALLQYFNETYNRRLPKAKCDEKAEELFQFIMNLRETKEISSLKKNLLL
tara:strand:- start:97 stop:516 length:420 start_codon:yes stop_codon:yes gene_type:complete